MCGYLIYWICTEKYTSRKILPFVLEIRCICPILMNAESIRGGRITCKYVLMFFGNLDSSILVWKYFPCHPMLGLRYQHSKMLSFITFFWWHILPFPPRVMSLPFPPPVFFSVSISFSHFFCFCESSLPVLWNWSGIVPLMIFPPLPLSSSSSFDHCSWHC